MKISSGVVLAVASWAVSGWSILISVGYALGPILGTGGETPDLFFVLLWIVVLTGVGLSVWARMLLKRGIVLTLPISTVVTVYLMLYVVYPVVACQRHTCIIVPRF